MNITVQGLRSALKTICLFVLAALATGIVVMMLGALNINTSNVHAWTTLEVIGLVFGQAVLTGAVGAAYFLLLALFWIAQPEEKPVPPTVEKWATSLTPDEREAQLKRASTRSIGLAGIATLIFLVMLPIMASDIEQRAWIAVPPMIFLFFSMEVIRRIGVRENYHRQLLEAQREHEHSA